MVCATPIYDQIVSRGKAISCQSETICGGFNHYAYVNSDMHSGGSLDPRSVNQVDLCPGPKPTHVKRRFLLPDVYLRLCGRTNVAPLLLAESQYVCSAVCSSFKVNSWKERSGWQLGT